MGCDWVAIRNLTIAVGTFTAMATSSTIFAFNWDRWAPDGPWKTIVVKISFSAAATWASFAIVMLAILMSVASSFCSCASSIRACAMACAALTIALRALLGCLIALIAVCLAAAADDALLQNPVFLGGMGAAVGACIVAMAAVGTFATQIASCQ